MTSGRRQGLSVLGIGTAVCAACCAGPILAVLGGLSVAGFASTVVTGAGGVVVGLVALAAYAALRRRRADRACAPEPVTLSARPGSAPR